MKPEMKKLIIANLPYLLFVYLFGKLGQAYRLAEGIDLSQKLLHLSLIHISLRRFFSYKCLRMVLMAPFSNRLTCA